MTPHSRGIPAGTCRLDCPPRFEDGAAFTVMRNGPPTDRMVSDSKGMEALIRDSEILLDEKWVFCWAPLPSEYPVDLVAMQNDIKSGGLASHD